MKPKEFYVETQDKRKLRVLKFTPNTKEIQGVVHILHGMGEHAKRYQAFGEFLTSKGYVMYAHDHRNHGGSLKKNQDIGIFDITETFEVVVRDVKDVHDFILKHEEVKDLTMLGHSMGSIILRRYLQQFSSDVDRAIIMGSPPVQNPFSLAVTRAFVHLSGSCKSRAKRHKFVANMLNNSIRKPIKKAKTSLDWLSHNPDNIEAYHKDPKSGFTYNKYFYRYFLRCLYTTNKPSEMKKSPLIPHLYISGVDDPMSKNMKQIHKLARRQKAYVPFHEMKIIGIENARHEVLNEKAPEKTYDKILQWIKDH